MASTDTGRGDHTVAESNRAPVRAGLGGVPHSCGRPHPDRPAIRPVGMVGVVAGRVRAQRRQNGGRAVPHRVLPMRTRFGTRGLPGRCTPPGGPRRPGGAALRPDPRLGAVGGRRVRGGELCGALARRHRRRARRLAPRRVARDRARRLERRVAVAVAGPCTAAAGAASSWRSPLGCRSCSASGWRRASPSSGSSPIRGERGVTVTARRDLGGDGAVTWHSTLTRGLSWSGDGVAEDAARASADLQSEYGSGSPGW